jgi:hypothetical protein
MGFLFWQGSILIVALHSIQVGISTKPSRQNGQGQVMLPGTVFAGLVFIPTNFVFSILVAALDQVAMRLTLCGPAFSSALATN